jgi:ribonuclease-3
MNKLVLQQLTGVLGYSFRDPALLRLALTHRSFAHERGQGLGEHNERLEFLGDAVVDLSVACMLMELLPGAREGRLTKLRAMVVREESLAQGARQLGLGDFLRLGRGEAQSGGRDKPSILSDTYEALMGAIYLDAGFDEADRVIRQSLGPLLAEAVEGELDRDFKGRLQEVIQARGDPAPRYEVVDEWGPDHDKTFVAAVFMDDAELARAEGASKKVAEQRAARNALLKMSKSRDLTRKT